MDAIEIQPLGGSVNASIRPPGSKSLTNRALIIAALAVGSSELTGALASEDTRVMIESLTKLGIAVEHNLETKTIRVSGGGGYFKNSSADLHVENSGTTIRFLTAVLGVAGGNYSLDGIHRMRERPIGQLVDALSSAGASIAALSPNQCPPVRIDSPRLNGGHIKIRGDISSQYLSGLLMAAPIAENGMTIEIDGPLISKPYIHMTTKIMESFGVQCQSNFNSGEHTESDAKAAKNPKFEISAGQNYIGRSYAIEPDASAASYFLAAAAICGGSATVEGLNANSLQGDIDFAKCLGLMGCDVSFGDDSVTVSGAAQNGIDIDMSNVSDTVQTLTSVALFVDSPTRVRNVAHNRVKETDRIGNLAIELRKFGATVEEFEDGLKITPPQTMTGASINTYNDHRMAMSLALVGLKQPGVVINNPGCVSKTYPEFFDDLQTFCGQS